MILQIDLIEVIMKKILIVLVMISILFSSHVYGEVDGWKDYKFGMSIEEVNEILKDQCNSMESPPQNNNYQPKNLN